MSDGPRIPTSTTDIELKLLLEAIYERFHYDFRQYSQASLRRRVAASLAPLGCKTVSELMGQLLHDPSVFPKLLQYLTVPVSDMFRDPSFFRAFRERVVPELRTYPSIRLWVAGCSTGEEVYSYAIVLREEGLLDKALLYATDINPESLAKAEAGVYALSRIKDFSQNHLLAGGRRALSDYYTAAYDAALFDRTLRKRIVFSDHSLATDSVFAEVQVVSCRNVLIYFDKGLQTRALRLFRESLSRRGFLGLGARETLQFTPEAGAFNELGSERWYQRC
jgi:chemotaxis protein methyltransferase CheR